jgi:predicted DsbA family dithiol-disulfide isomerase
MTHPTRLKIDFVSDVSCPWCVIGLKGLEQALSRLTGEVEADLHFQPFELNPGMAKGGEDVGEHLSRKYGATMEQMAPTREALRARGAELGFTFRLDQRQRIYNTFDAHRLLHWAGLESATKEHALKNALFTAYFTDGKDLSDHEVLADAAVAAGLDRTQALAILGSDTYTEEVREREQHFQSLGIQAVPSIIINDRHLIQGGQPVATFEAALRKIADRPLPASVS